MKTKMSFLLGLVCATGLLFTSGCEDGDDDDGGEIAEGNDRNLVVCIGDSITQGYACDGAPYPSQLAGMSGKQVVNYGAGGATSSAAPGAAQRAVAQKPGYVCILYGSNDAITGKSADAAKENIRAAIGVCKNAGVRAIVGTPPPMRDGHSLYDGPARGVAEAIRAVASEEGVPCVDLYGAFGDCNGLLVADGLHPNAAGAQLIASKFNSKL